MYTTKRYFLRYGNEDDVVDVTTKEFEDFEKALQYARRYCNGRRFLSVEILDDNDNMLYEFVAGVGEEFFKIVTVSEKYSHRYGTFNCRIFRDGIEYWGNYSMETNACYLASENGVVLASRGDDGEGGGYGWSAVRFFLRGF